MRRSIDLHTHSNASDGRNAPAEVIALADAASLAAVALTDHDTTAGLDEAIAAAEDYPDLQFVRGIELSAKFHWGMLHILGLAIDHRDKELTALTDRLIESRNERNPRILERLGEMGMDVQMSDVLDTLSGASAKSQRPVVGRMHIGEAMRRKGYVKSTAEAFDRYIGNSGSAFVDKERLAPREVAHAVHHAGGLAVLAHPAHLDYANSAQLERLVRGLVDSGIDGIEVSHPDHSAFQTRSYLQLARRLGLAAVGGSDYHGAAKPHVQIGRPRVSLALLGKSTRRKLLGDR